MPGFLAGHELSRNRIEAAKQARISAGLPLLDLTSSNPTQNGYLFPANVLEEAFGQYLRSRRYEPDAKGLIAARKAIAGYYSFRQPALEISPEHVFITASTSEAYVLLFSLLCDPGDTIVSPQISYPLFDYFAEMFRISLKLYHMLEAGDWETDEDSLRVAKAENARAVLFVSPHNPTGKIISNRQEAVAELGLPLIADEVFAEFPVLKNTAPPLGILYPELPVFHLNGISKMFALPDLKLGWIALNEPAYQLFGARLAILNDTLLGASGAIQYALPVVLQEGRSFSEWMQKKICASLGDAVNILKESPGIQVRLPDGGTFLFPRIEHPDEEELVLKLLERGVYVHPGYFYGAEEGAHIMISCITQRETLLEGVRRIAAFLR